MEGWQTGTGRRAGSDPAQIVNVRSGMAVGEGAGRGVDEGATVEAGVVGRRGVSTGVGEAGGRQEVSAMHNVATSRERSIFIVLPLPMAATAGWRPRPGCGSAG